MALTANPPARSHTTTRGEGAIRLSYRAGSGSIDEAHAAEWTAIRIGGERRGSVIASRDLSSSFACCAFAPARFHEQAEGPLSREWAPPGRPAGLARTSPPQEKTETYERRRHPQNPSPTAHRRPGGTRALRGRVRGLRRRLRRLRGRGAFARLVPGRARLRPCRAAEHGDRRSRGSRRDSLRLGHCSAPPMAWHATGSARPRCSRQPPEGPPSFGWSRSSDAPRMRSRR